MQSLDLCSGALERKQRVDPSAQTTYEIQYLFQTDLYLSIRKPESR